MNFQEKIIRLKLRKNCKLKVKAGHKVKAYGLLAPLEHSFSEFLLTCVIQDLNLRSNLPEFTS